MAPCLFIFPDLAAFYIGYVVIFNMLVGPVFSAGSVTSERERQTLDLLLTTTITPWQILWGKLVAGLRISSVLTLFLAWPLLLACVMVMYYWENILAVLAFAGIILTTCATTAIIAMFCSVIFRKTSMSLMTSYIIIMVLFCLPLPMTFFVKVFMYPETRQVGAGQNGGARVLQREEGSVGNWIQYVGITSPFAAAFSVPLDSSDALSDTDPWMHDYFPPSVLLVGGYFLWSFLLISILSVLMIWLFNTRWRVSQ
jgi:ABC-type transport system involved in multi-copper enzyme maturation permease subunit